MAAIALSIFVASATYNAAPFLPSTHDAHGWALRVRAKGLEGPYFLQESPDHPELEIILINRSTRTLSYRLFEEARKTGDFRGALKWPNGIFMDCTFEPWRRRPDEPSPQLRPGNWAPARYRLSDFGYRRFRATGQFIGQIEFRTDQGTVLSAPWKFSVVDVPPNGVLATHTVPIAGVMAKLPAAKRDKICIQQVRVSDRVFLIYRRFTSSEYGGVVASTHRLAELPGKVEMTVEGVYQKNEALTIMYRSTRSTTTTLTIDSIDGTIWDRWDRPARADDFNIIPVAPAPRPVRS